MGGILIGLILLWGLPAISAFNPELLQQYHFLISIKATSDTLYGKIGLHTGLMIPLVAGLGFMAFNRKWHPFLSLPALALASATAYYFATEGTMLAQQLGSAGASKIGTAAFFLTGFAIASFLGAIGFFRKEVVEISQKMQVTPLTMGL